jgi:hypothetical protein
MGDGPAGVWEATRPWHGGTRGGSLMGAYPRGHQRMSGHQKMSGPLSPV